MVDVEIVVQKGNKAFLGGFRNSKSGSEYHHAITQTVEGKRRDWNQITEGTFCSTLIRFVLMYVLKTK